MSNNIYDILKNFNNLDSVKNMLNEGKAVCKSCGKAKCKCVDESKGSKPDFLDMDKDGDTKEPMKKAAKTKSKGAVAEAVAQVEKQLNEKYMGFKKTVGALKKQGGIENPEGLAASIGRKKYGKEKFQKAAAAGRKMGEDLDPKYKSPEWDSYQQAVTKNPEYRTTNPGAGVAAHGNDERGQQSYKDRTSPGIINKVKDVVGYDKPNPAYGPKGVQEGDANEDMLSPGQKKIARMSPPPDKIDANDLKALRAGKDKKKEGNAFSGAMAKAKASGQDEFNVGGKEYAVKEGSPKKKTQSPDEQHKVVAGVRDAMRKGYDNVQKGRDERAAARFVAKLKYGINDSKKTNEGFPTVADAKKRMDDREGKTTHGKKTATATGTRHERDYDAVDKGADVDMTPKGRGRPKKDRFA
jgi:hypothetical protein